MHATAALAATLAAAASVHAFRGTYPIVAWSPNGHLPSLPELDAVSSTPSLTAQQQHFETSNADLCQLDALYIVSVPGLHASDLAAFPSASATSGFRASLAEAQVSGAARTAPYVSDRLAVPPVGKIARRFARCGAGKRVQFTRFDDLITGGEGALHGVSSEEEWRAAMLALLDSQIADMLASAPESSAFLLTDLPYKLSSASPKLAKRQQLIPSDTSEETIEEVLEEIADEEDVNSNALDEMLAEIESADEDHSAPSMSAEDEADAYASLDGWDGRILDVSASAKNASKNGTSIFAPDGHSGLLHRYALFSPSLIVAILVTVVVLIPTVLVGTQALLSIETVNGLETKMTGSVGLDPSKQ